MKRLRNIFVIIAVLTALSVNAQLPCTSAEAPTVQFQSTSTLTGSGSGVASAVTTGGVFESSMTTGKPLAHKISSVRRDVGDDEVAGDDDPNKPANPFPIGDGVWAMIIMAAGYCLFRKKVKKICTIEK